jgi:CrcB protein
MRDLDARELTAVFAGGVLGALARAGLVRAFPHDPGTWPWVTFAVNVAGAALLGYLVTRLQERLPLSAYRRPLLGSGFCGALTTFSTMQLELVQMLDADRAGLALTYAAASLAAGFAAVFLATKLTRRVLPA